MNKIDIDLSWIVRLWSEEANLSLSQAILLGLFFFLCNFVFCFCTHFIQKESMIEYGFPGIKKKTLIKKISMHRILDRITLMGLYREAERKGFIMILCLLCNMLAVLAAIVELVGYIACIISGEIGWSLTLVMIPGFAVFIFTNVIEAVPFRICLPSEKGRYKK